MKRLKRQFQGLYWRQLYVTAGTVMLTLLLLGASFFALSYNLSLIHILYHGETGMSI